MNKRKLLIGLVFLAGSAYFSYNLLNEKKASDDQQAIFNFEIKDTASVDKIIVTEPSGMKIEVVRNGKTWMESKGNCIQSSMVNDILDACFNISFKGYVPDNMVKNASKSLATSATKVEYFMNGEWTKTWYVGGATADHLGTFMLVESETKGKSDLPVIMEIKGVRGIIGPRFVADLRQWECTGIFAHNVADISSVDVQFTAKPERSFRVDNQGKKIEVVYSGKRLQGLPYAIGNRYLTNFRRINFQNPNYELTDRQLDSLKRATPFCKMNLTLKNKQNKRLRMWYRKGNGEIQTDNFGEDSPYDIDVFWCETPSGKIVKCQFFVFLPLINGSISFSAPGKSPL